MKPESQNADAARIERLEGAVERLTALLFLTNSRLTKLEGSGGDAADETTLKGAVFLTGFSSSQVRKDLAAGRSIGRKIDGRWVIKVASLRGVRK
jgi:hypothetical protein